MLLLNICFWPCLLVLHMVSGWKEDPREIFDREYIDDTLTDRYDSDNLEGKAPILTLKGIGWWMALGVRNGKDRPLTNLYEVRKKNSQNSISNKNSMHRRFSFGIGKRNGETWLMDDNDDTEWDNSPWLTDDKRANNGENRYSFGIGKRERQRYSFGLGKREVNLKELADLQKEDDKRSRKFSFGLGKREDLEEEKRSKSYSFGLGKRDLDEDVKRGGGPNMQYSFGLGKRELETDDEPEKVYPMESSELFDKRNRNFNFGLGKRMGFDNSEFVPSDEEEKRALAYSFGLGKRGKSYSFGLGKRGNQKVYGFGLGKRQDEEVEEENKRNKMYGFGIGKREDKKSKSYSFGLGKRTDAEESSTDEAAKRSRSNQYSFGLGKRTTTADNGNVASPQATSSDNALHQP